MNDPTPYPPRVARIVTRLADLFRAAAEVERLSLGIARDLGHLDPARRLDSPRGCGMNNRSLARLLRGIAWQGEGPFATLRCELPAETLYLMGEFDHDPDASPQRQAMAEMLRYRAMEKLALSDPGPDGEAAPSQS